MKASERRRSRAAPTSFAPVKASAEGAGKLPQGADEGSGKAAEPRGTNELRAGEGLGREQERLPQGADEGFGKAAEPRGTNELRAGESHRRRREGEKGELAGGEGVRGGAKLVGAGSCAAFPEDEPFGMSPDPPQAEKITATLLPGV